MTFRDNSSRRASDPGILEIFLRSVSLYPENVAVKSHARSLTYAEIDRTSGLIGDFLFRMLDDTPLPIALLLDDGALIISGLLGVLRSGHFYSILSSKNPPARNREILKDLHTPLLISSPSLLESAREVAPQGCRVVSFDETQQAGESSFYRQVAEDSYAAVYYTSGSTGEPKGVLRSHRLLIKRGLLEVENQHIQPDNRFLLCYSLGSTATLSTVFGALFGGASLQIYEADKAGTASMKDIIWREKITHLRIPVELLRYFLDSLPGDSFFPAVRFIISAGDVLYFKDLERLRPHIPADSWFITQLSMTEFGLLATNRIRFDQSFPDGVVPVGLPSRGKEIIILGENENQLEIGETGEVCLRTDVKFSGYWNRPDLTSAKIISDPADPSHVIYRTGDLGRIRPDGQLELAGRMDHGVKIRGFSVDTFAVESVLMSVDGVRRGVVTAPINPAGEKRLAAYVMPAAGVKLTAQSLRQALSVKLPDYMLPSHYVILSELPLTPTGKVDRKALPAPRWNQPERAVPYVAPRDEFEQKLVKAWRAVLRVDAIGIEDDFFELGGDSLMAASLMVSIEDVFSRRLPVSMMLKSSTIRQQAELLRSNVSNVYEPLLISIRTAGSKQPLICLGGKGGTPIRFNRLLEHIGQDQPVYYFRSRGLDQDERTEDFVEDIAVDFIDELKRVQPHGPYYFLGESSGGIVAYEVLSNCSCRVRRLHFLACWIRICPGIAAPTRSAGCCC